jgi:hypothetical protein
VPCFLNTRRVRKIGDHMSISLIEDERLRPLRGARNALLLASPFWAGLIYWLTRYPQFGAER